MQPCFIACYFSLYGSIDQHYVAIFYQINHIDVIHYLLAHFLFHFLWTHFFTMKLMIPHELDWTISAYSAYFRASSSILFNHQAGIHNYSISVQNFKRCPLYLFCKHLSVILFAALYFHLCMLYSYCRACKDRAINCSASLSYSHNYSLTSILFINTCSIDPPPILYNFQIPINSHLRYGSTSQ